MKKWCEEHEVSIVFSLFFGFIVLLICGIVWLGVIAQADEDKKKQVCIASGGQWVVDHYEVSGGNSYPVSACRGGR